ncbi:MAG: DUF4254 domain-containing protein [Clostridium sp.]|nr:DUF4254 domain-containing protein [Clostridium sp.]
MDFAEKCNRIFWNTTQLYHYTDDIDAAVENPYAEGTIEHDLFRKNWIDAVQWHMEDLIRDPKIDPVEALELKRRIDRSNQDRTDLVERIDSYFLEKFPPSKALPDARINTETPAWAVDRLSILALKIYHMDAEVNRADASAAHVAKCRDKLRTLLVQREDLSRAISELLDDLEAGRKVMKVYKQMKMYNDPETNPVLYAGK